MITLYTFGRYFGLPDPSPFVMKAMLLLKFAGLPFHKDESSLKVNRVHDYIAAVRKGFARAPKGKMPYIDDDGTIVADSTFIRLHIEKKYGFDFDPGLGPEQKASAWAVEKMCEEHLYWALVAERWCIDENFAKGPAQFFFEAVPMPLRPLAQFMVRRRVGKKGWTCKALGATPGASKPPLP